MWITSLLGTLWLIRLIWPSDLPWPSLTSDFKFMGLWPNLHFHVCSGWFGLFKFDLKQVEKSRYVLRWIYMLKDPANYDIGAVAGSAWFRYAGQAFTARLTLLGDNSARFPCAKLPIISFQQLSPIHCLLCTLLPKINDSPFINIPIFHLTSSLPATPRTPPSLLIQAMCNP